MERRKPHTSPKTLPRNYGDEHGGYIADVEAEHTMDGTPDDDAPKDKRPAATDADGLTHRTADASAARCDVDRAASAEREADKTK